MGGRTALCLGVLFAPQACVRKVREKKLSSPSVVWAEMNNDRTPEPEVKVRNSDSVKARQFRAEDEWPSGTSKGGCSVR